MKINRTTIAITAAIAVFGATGAGIAHAVGDGSEEQVTGPDAEKAKTAALEAVGGGTVTEIEHQDGDGAGLFEVEVLRDDGSQVEVHIDGQYQPVGTVADDDTGSGSDDDAGEGADSDD
jgi:hypothetical protein